MKYPVKVLIILFFVLTSLSTLYALPTQYYHYRLPRHYYKTFYYPPHYYHSNLDGEVDNACVDACLDLTHTLKDCMRACYH